MWTASVSEPLLFEQAQEYVRNLRAGGFDDWRLPTGQEIQTLIRPATSEEIDRLIAQTAAAETAPATRKSAYDDILTELGAQPTQPAAPQPPAPAKPAADPNLIGLGPARSPPAEVAPAVQSRPALRDEFAVPEIGFVFAGNTSGAHHPDGPLVMNLRNGRVFNGQGYGAYVRAVRGKPKVQIGNRVVERVIDEFFEHLRVPAQGQAPTNKDLDAAIAARWEQQGAAPAAPSPPTLPQPPTLPASTKVDNWQAQTFLSTTGSLTNRIEYMHNWNQMGGLYCRIYNGAGETLKRVTIRVSYRKDGATAFRDIDLNLEFSFLTPRTVKSVLVEAGITQAEFVGLEIVDATFAAR
jgi:hypothetical protein